MKQFFISFCLMLGVFFAQAQDNTQQAAPGNGPQITYDETTHDFGDIVQGQIVTYTFKFQNTGKEPLIVSNVLTTCGCTVPAWPKEPIAPGKKGEITATFNSAGKMGKQNKVITVLSNATNNQTQVTIISNVLQKPGDGMKATPAPHSH